MSKGNMLLGYARGAVGDLVFARNKGQQTTKARNRNPFNPRTENQMVQRSVMSNNVKFFTRGVQNLFKFAFEHKNSKESDFNAFIRYNRQNGVMISQSAFECQGYPALGKFIMSHGSLPTPITRYDKEDHVYTFDAQGASENATIGEISKVLKRKYQLQNGDMVTFLRILCSNSTQFNTPAVYPAERPLTTWDIAQIIIDPTSDVSITEALQNVNANYDGVGIIVPELTINEVGAFCVIFSRPGIRGLKTSTSQLLLNEAATICADNAIQPEYTNAVLESWSSEPRSILQGSVEEQNPDLHGYTFELYQDEECTTLLSYGMRINRAYLKCNKTIQPFENTQSLTNSLYIWHDFQVEVITTSVGTLAWQFEAFNYNLETSQRDTFPKAGDVIAMAAPEGQSFTIVDKPYVQFLPF